MLDRWQVVYSKKPNSIIKAKAKKSSLDKWIIWVAFCLAHILWTTYPFSLHFVIWGHRLWVCMYGPGKKITETTSASAESFGNVLAEFLPTLPLVMNWVPSVLITQLLLIQVRPSHRRVNLPFKVSLQSPEIQSHFSFCAAFCIVLSMRLCLSLCVLSWGPPIPHSTDTGWEEFESTGGS